MNTEATSNEQLTGAEILVRCLAEEGVEHVFGYPGGAVLYIYDAIFKQDKFQHILVRHEQAAVHAADLVGAARIGVGGVHGGLLVAYQDVLEFVLLEDGVDAYSRSSNKV